MRHLALRISRDAKNPAGTRNAQLQTHADEASTKRRRDLAGAYLATFDNIYYVTLEIGSGSHMQLRTCDKKARIAT
jgi:hypothetical protein